MRRATKSACRLLFSYKQQSYTTRLFATAAAAAKHACSPGPVSAQASIATTTIATSPCQPVSSRRAKVLDGRAVAAAWEKELAGDVELLTKLLGRPPGLGVVLVGTRPDSLLYVTKKQEACQKAGVCTFIRQLPECVTQAQLEAAVAATCSDPRVDGVLIQLPLPRHLSEEAVMEVLDPRKDVDGFHPLNMGRMLMRGRGVRLVPATPLGCIELLRRSGVDVQGKTCVVLGDSNIVGTPLAAMLRDRGAAAVTICHRRSYRDWFEDQGEVRRKRAAAAVCLPPLPGPSPRPPAPQPPQPPQPPTPCRTASLSGVHTGLEQQPQQQQQQQCCQQQQEIAAEAAGTTLPGDTSPSSSSSPFSASLPSCPPKSSTAAETLTTTAAAAYDSFQSYRLPDLTRSADILVVAVGHPELVRGDWVRPGAVVVDVGINVVGTLPRTPAAPASSTAASAASATADNIAPAAAAADSAACSARTAAAATGKGHEQQEPQGPNHAHPSTDSQQHQQQQLPLQGAASGTSREVTTGKDGCCYQGPQAAAVQQQDGICLGAGSGGGAEAVDVEVAEATARGVTEATTSASRPGASGAEGSSSSNEANDDEGCGPLCNRSVTFHVVGDVAFDEVSQVAGAITPVPGGVGPMTIAALLHNTLKAAKYRVGLETW